MGSFHVAPTRTYAPIALSGQHFLGDSSSATLRGEHPAGEEWLSMGVDLNELRCLRRARDQMDREYAQPLDVAELARTAMMSPAHFSRRFREAYSESPYSYLMTRRVERAKALLRRGDLSVTDVCFAVGWTSLGSFSTRFTELVGESPSSYQAQRHETLRVVSPCQLMVMTRPRKGGRPTGREESSFEEESAYSADYP